MSYTLNIFDLWPNVRTRRIASIPARSVASPTVPKLYLRFLKMLRQQNTPNAANDVRERQIEGTVKVVRGMKFAEAQKVWVFRRLPSLGAWLDSRKSGIRHMLMNRP